MRPIMAYFIEFCSAFNKRPKKILMHEKKLKRKKRIPLSSQEKTKSAEIRENIKTTD